MQQYLIQSSPESPIVFKSRFLREWISLRRKTLVYDGDIFRLSGSSEKFIGLSATTVAMRLLELFERKGEALFPDLIGEFALSIIDEEKRLVTSYRSRTSRFQIYYADGLISNHLLPIARMHKNIKLDENYLSRFMLQSQSPAYHSPLTPIEGIHRLLPGYCLHLKEYKVSDSLLLDKKVYETLTDYSQTCETVAPQIHSLITEVTEDRLANNQGKAIVCELSGGLDSSYISSIVGSQQSEVSAYMYSYPDHPSHRLSEECAKAVANKYGIDLTIISPSEVLSIDLSATLPYSDEPSPFFWQGAMFCPRTNEMIPEGATIFSGFGADQLFLRTPQILPWLLKRKDFKTFSKVLSEVAASESRSSSNLLYQSVLALLPRERYVSLFQACRGLIFNPFSTEDIDSQMRDLESIAWFRPTSSKTGLQFHCQLLAEEANGAAQLFGKDHSIHTDLGYVTFPHFVMDPYLGLKGIQYQSPFCDPRVIEFLASKVSWHLIHDFKAPYKNLLREAQRGVVPEVVRTRKKNEFLFDGFLSRLFKSNQVYLRQLLRSVDDLNDEIFNQESIIPAFEENLFGQTSNSAHKIISLVGYLIWFRDFKHYHSMASHWDSQEGA